MVLLINIIILVLFIFIQEGDVAEDFHNLKKYHNPVTLRDNDVITVANLSDMSRFDRILTNILVPRVVGTETHKKVKEFIIRELKGLKWSVETHESKQNTPFGRLTFTNIIGRLNPSAERYLVLACHYDSKHMRENEFLGATDSAVPCAMMIDLAYALNDKLAQYKDSSLSLMLLFFDGEEAFVSWGPNDSIYGARSLASKWGKTAYPRASSNTRELDRMDLLVLLDLLGAPQPSFYSYFRNTQRWYMQMASGEQRLAELGQLQRHSQPYFFKAHLTAHIEDDHIPFLRKDVQCLHVIPTPFPDCWHQPDDNRNALDTDTINNLNKILRVFTLEYLGGSVRRTRSSEMTEPDL